MTHHLTPNNDYGLFKCGEKNRNAKLHKLDIYLIREFIKYGYTQKAIAEMFEVSRNAISQINTGKTWVWLE